MQKEKEPRINEYSDWILKKYDMIFLSPTYLINIISNNKNKYNKNIYKLTKKIKNALQCTKTTYLI